MKKNFNIMVLILFGSFFTSRPIPEQAAYGLAAVTGCIGGIAAYNASNQSWLITVPVMGCATYLGYKFFYQFTPQGKIARAQYILNNIRAYSLATERARSATIIIDHVKNDYITEWPLVSAYNNLASLVGDANSAMELALEAKQEDFTYKHTADNIIDELRFMRGNMTEVIKVIRDNPDYLKQLELYKEEERRKKELAVKQSQANAQWSQADAQHKQAGAQDRQADAQHRQADAQHERAQAEKQAKHVFVHHDVTK